MKPLRNAALGMLMASCLWAPAFADETRLAQLFAANCAQCHLRPGIGAPMAGVAADWEARIARGEDALLRNVVEGIGGMPPLGYCGACSEDDLRALTRMMAGIPR